MSDLANTGSRRGFLRQLCSLPMVGGGVSLIGAPTASAVSVTDALLDGYDEWLFYERRLLHVERFGMDQSRKSVKYVPCSGWVSSFHFPSMQDHHAQPPWIDVPKPSARAALVLSAVGIDVEGGARD